MLVANIGKLQEIFHSKRAAKFRIKRTPFSQPKSDFAAMRNLPSAWSDRLPMAVTPSFQLRITYRLKHWIVNFLSFETTYSLIYVETKTELLRPIEQGTVQSTPKTILKFRVQSNRAPTIMKTRYDYDMTKHTSVVYTKNQTVIISSIEPSAVCDKNQAGQRHDRSYRSSLSN
uniref:Uncharacterized protein n=1 Tax=Vitis vinifera TaxID=29760 RepID=A5C2P2_VITVI|nr:hypothetical protein VITISV_032145 [Vitis vinifera]